MRNFKKSSTTVFTILALVLVPAFPAVAQTASAEASVSSSYTVHVDKAPQTENALEDGSVTLTVEQKQGAVSGDVVVTWKKVPGTKTETGGREAANTAAGYVVETAKKKVAAIE